MSPTQRTLNGYTWDERLGRYRGPGGRIVSRAQVREAIDEALRTASLRARDLALELRAGSITIDAWEVAMRELVKDVHLYSAAAVRGGWDRMTQGDYGRVGQLVRTQFRYLDGFAQDIADGRQRLGQPGFLRRAMMYAEAGRGTHEAFVQSDARKRARELGGRLEARNILGDARHCQQCVALTARGWIPDEEMVPPGMRTCLSHCHCHVERRLVDEEGDELEVDDLEPVDAEDDLEEE